MEADRQRLYGFLRQGLDGRAVDGVMTALERLFVAAETGLVGLRPSSDLDREAILAAARDVLHDDDPASGMHGFATRTLKVVPLDAAAHLRSKSAGTVRSTDWPPPGISSFGVSALLYLRYSADMRDDVFARVHNAAHETLLIPLRAARLPDGRLLGREWIVPWTTVADSVFFYLTHSLLGLDEAADTLGRFVRHLPGILPMGFTLDSEFDTSGELVVLAG